jgi:hypothetical protein
MKLTFPSHELFLVVSLPAVRGHVPEKAILYRGNYACRHLRGERRSAGVVIAKLVIKDMGINNVIEGIGVNPSSVSRIISAATQQKQPRP